MAASWRGRHRRGGEPGAAAGPGAGVLTEQELPAGLEPVALVAALEEKVREDAPDTMRYFASQDVTVKVISGDNPATVAAVAERAGVAGAEPAGGRAQPPDDQDELADAMRRAHRLRAGGPPPEAGHGQGPAVRRATSWP